MRLHPGDAAAGIEDRARAARSGCRSRRRRGACTRSSTPTWSWPRAWCRSSAAATPARSRSWRSAARARCTAAGWPQALGIPRVILPAAAGVTAAIGLLAAEVRFDVARTFVRRLDALDPAQLEAMYDGDGRAGRRRGARVGRGRRADRRALGRRALRRPGLRADGAGARRRARRPRRWPASARRSTRSTPPATATRSRRRAGRGRHLEAVGRSAARRGSRCRRPPTTRASAAGSRAERRAYFPEARRLDRCPIYDRYELAGRHAARGPGHRRGARVDLRAAAGRAWPGGRR